MNLTPKGKIGRLPKAVQEQLNQRMRRGEKGWQLVAWLNSLPAVQAVMVAEFEGKPVFEQNLSQWRKHGYQAWLWRQDALDTVQAMAEKTGGLPAPGAPPLTEQMAAWASVRYLMAVRGLVGKGAGGKPELKVLRHFCHDIVALRRGEHSEARLKLEHKRLERRLTMPLQSSF